MGPYLLGFKTNMGYIGWLAKGAALLMLALLGAILISLTISAWRAIDRFAISGDHLYWTANRSSPVVVHESTAHSYCLGRRRPRTT